MHQSTLLFVQSECQSVDIDEQVETCIQLLQQLGHVTVSNSFKTEVTQLGQATFKGQMKNQRGNFKNLLHQISILTYICSIVMVIIID